MTPDHLHATISSRHEKGQARDHRHKPIANRVDEAQQSDRDGAARPRSQRISCPGTTIGSMDRSSCSGSRTAPSARCARSTTGPTGPSGRSSLTLPRIGRPSPRASIGTSGWGRSRPPLSPALHAHGVPRLVRFRRRLHGRHGPLQPVAGLPDAQSAGRPSASKRRPVTACTITDQRQQPGSETTYSFPLASTVPLQVPGRATESGPSICVGTTAA